MSAGTWLPSPVRAVASNASPRVTASDPGAWLDGEPWIFTLTFTDPDGVTPTDLTGSRLFVNFTTNSAGFLETIQGCDSAAGDGALIIVDAINGKAAFNVSPENRTWKAPYSGPGLLLLPTLVFGDVYRQLGNADPVGLTRITLRVLPSTGSTTGSGPPIIPPVGSSVDFSDPANSGLLAALCIGLPSSVPPPTGASSFDFSDPANSGLLVAICAGNLASSPSNPASFDFSAPANSGLLAATGA